MSNISEFRCAEFKGMVDRLDLEQACNLWGVSIDTGERYLRKYRHRIMNVGAKVLFFDIETAPMEFYGWQCGKQYVQPENIIRDWFILSWSAKWMDGGDVFGSVVTPDEAIKRDDKRVTKLLWEQIEHADIIIAHNGRQFDVKKMNTRFVKHGFKKPMPYQLIDTLIVARDQFRFSSNKLNELAKFFGLPGKIHTEFNLWKRCVAGDLEALTEMDTYCQQDIRVLEDVYYKLRGYMRSHPNMGIFHETNESVCPVCRSDKLYWSGRYNTMVSSFEAFRCQECGAQGRGRKSTLEKEHRAVLTVSTAR